MTVPLKKSISVFVTLCFLVFPQGVYALPQGENMVGGNASYDYATPNELTITQTTDRLATEWDSFSIGTPEMVKFIQTQGSSSIALNKVVGVDPSQILGALWSITEKLRLLDRVAMRRF